MLKTLGLLAFASEFVKGGLNQTKQSERMAGQAQKAGLPITPEFVRVSGWVMVACGAALQIPFLRKPAALILAMMLVPITYVGHRFWEIEDTQQRNTQLTQVFKNTTMLGGALFIAGTK
jgi:putative oxidoreductase